MRTSHRLAAVSTIAVVAASLSGFAPAAAEDPLLDCDPYEGVVDFNGDNITDTVRAFPDSSVDGPDAAGEVKVLYGDNKGTLSITQETTGVSGTSEAGDRFGYSLAVTDLDSNGCEDLLIGVPFEDIGSLGDAGRVVVVYGSPTGLLPVTTVDYTQDTEGFPGTAEAGDRFGYAVDATISAWAISAPGEDDNAADAGTVYVSRYNAAPTVVSQDSYGVSGNQENGDRFGSALAVTGNLLVVGTPDEAVGSATDAGYVQFFTTDTGVALELAALNQNTAGISGTSEADDRFGASVAATALIDMDGGIHYRAAIGAPGESLNAGQTENGQVHLISADADVFVPAETAAFTQNSAGVLGVAETADGFGSGLTLAAIPAPNDPESQIAVLAVEASGEFADDEQGSIPAVQTFQFSANPGDGDTWVTDGEFNLPQDAFLTGDAWSWNGRLFLASHDGDRVFGMPWVNLHGSGGEPIDVYQT